MYKISLSVAFSLAIISTVSAQCCDFETVNTCSPGTNQWQSSITVRPDLTDYPNFAATDTTNYMWIQDASGTVDIDTIITTTSSTTDVQLNFDYFYDSVTSPTNGDYLHLFLVVSQLKKYQIASITVTDPSWQHFDVVCDHNNDYCCGSLKDSPCSGTLEVVGSFDDRLDIGLMAIDNICGGASVPTTTTTTTAKPPPPPGACCHFNTDDCGCSYTNWYWTNVIGYFPPDPPPYSDGDYLWTIVPSQVTFPIVTINPSTTISFQYYISSPSVVLQFYFYPLSGGSMVSIPLTYTNHNWAPYNGPCPGCCTVGNCDGEFAFIYTGSSGTAAIDNFEIDNYCGDIPAPCCDFNDYTLCGYISGDTYGYTWKSSLASIVSYIPATGSAYIFFEVVSYTTPISFTNSLTSLNTVTISGTTYFEANVFGLSSALTASELQINFRYDTTYVYTMQTIKSTAGVWDAIAFSCNYLTCCGGLPSCTGTIEITAVIDANSGTSSFGVDYIEVRGQC